MLSTITPQKYCLIPVRILNQKLSNHGYDHNHDLSQNPEVVIHQVFHVFSLDL